MKNFAPNITAQVLTAALRVVPAGDHVFVHGVPGTEGNAVEIARAITELSDSTIVWPSAPSDEYLTAVDIPVHRIRRLPSTQTFASLWAYLRARAVFHTHGLYGNPVPAPRKPIINLWHGDSFKGGLLFPDRTLRGPNATYLVTSSQLIGGIKAERSHLSPSRLLVLGNPRISQMYTPPTNEQLKALGIDPEFPFVLWMPTFRIAKGANGEVAWTNTADPSSDQDLSSRAAEIAFELNRHGVRLVVKPHRLDATSRAIPGTVILDEVALAVHQVPLYRLIGASVGLISDYSSVWIDYLALDRPIGFLVDDIEDFRQSRDLTAPELIRDYPGLLLNTLENVDQFVREIKSGGQLGRARRQDFARTIGYVASASSAADVVRTVLNVR